MKAIRVLMVGMVALLASVAVACGGDDDSPSEGGSLSPGGGAGMIAPNTFMTYDGQRYELVNMLFENMVPENEFQPVGEVTEADVDLTDRRVFERSGDSSAVYTYSPPTSDDPGLWLAWRATS